MAWRGIFLSSTAALFWFWVVIMVRQSYLAFSRLVNVSSKVNSFDSYNQHFLVLVALEMLQ